MRGTLNHVLGETSSTRVRMAGYVYWDIEGTLLDLASADPQRHVASIIRPNGLVPEGLPTAGATKPQVIQRLVRTLGLSSVQSRALEPQAMAELDRVTLKDLRVVPAILRKGVAGALSLVQMLR